MSNPSQGCPEERECKCYKDPKSWIWTHFNKLKAILEPPQGNQKLLAGKENGKCPLEDNQEVGWCQQYAFEQAVLSENSEIQRLRLCVVPSPCVYEKSGEQTWEQAWCPDLILFKEDEKRLWALEVTTQRQSRGGRTSRIEKISGLIPKDWSSEEVRIRLERELTRVEDIKRYFNIPSGNSPSLVSLITEKEDDIPGKLSRIPIRKKKP